MRLEHVYAPVIWALIVGKMLISYQHFGSSGQWQDNCSVSLKRSRVIEIECGISPVSTLILAQLMYCRGEVALIIYACGE